MGKNKKVVVQRESAHNVKLPKIIESPEGYLKKHPIWAFQRCDLEHPKWSIKNCDSFCMDILDKLISYEGQTWAEIISASGGKKNGGTNNHFENISELCREAQKRILDLHLDIDQLFSLRLTGKQRLYGIVNSEVFTILWYDAEHEICPSTKKHT